MQPIEHVYIVACQRDFWMMKICLGSVRYWYPEIPVTLILDTPTGHFPDRHIREMVEIWKVNIFKAPPHCCGSWSKLNAFWMRPRERFLVLDADLVLLGPLLETLQEISTDFIVEWPEGPLLAPDEMQSFAAGNYLDIELVKAKFPHYQPAGFFFNAGQMVGRGGAIQYEDILPFINSTTIPTLSRYPKLFRWQDQGVLNFIVAEKLRLGRCTVQPYPFYEWAFGPVPHSRTLRQLRKKEGIPWVLHWAGPKLPFKASLPHSHILCFYENFYYSRVPWGKGKKWLRLWKRLREFKPGHHHHIMKEVDDRPWLRARILWAELWPRKKTHFPKIMKMAGA